MKKEVILAIVIGFGLGLVITFGIWVANRSLKNLGTSKSTSPTDTIITNTDAPTPSPAAVTTTSGLAITTPADEDLVTDSNIKVTGSTAVGNTIIVLHESGQDTVTVDASGNFTDSIKLVGGYNTITVVSVSPTGDQVTKSLVVTYTSAKLWSFHFYYWL